MRVFSIWSMRLRLKKVVILNISLSHAVAEFVFAKPGSAAAAAGRVIFGSRFRYVYKGELIVLPESWDLGFSEPPFLLRL